MTADERQEAERVWGAANAAFFAEQERSGCGGGAGVDVIAAARARWQNEALEEAARQFSLWHADHSGIRSKWIQEYQDRLRALKK